MRLAKDSAAFLAEDPLPLPTLGGKRQRHDNDIARLVTITPLSPYPSLRVRGSGYLS
jgi:hypothetical protein